MGSKNYDRWTPEEWRGETRSVRQMIERGWHVYSSCVVCGLNIATNLKLLVRVMGPEYSLWNRRLPCRRMGCSGQVRFFGKPPQIHNHIALDAEWPDAAPSRQRPTGQR